MRTKEDATKISKLMKEIGTLAGRETVCVLTNMDEPVGKAVGNTLEILETIECLKGNIPLDIKEIILGIGSQIIKLAGEGDNLEENKNRILEKLKYNYQVVEDSPYKDLLVFCEKVAELAILDKMAKRGNEEAKSYLIEQTQKILEMSIEKSDEFYPEKSEILQNIQRNALNQTQYGQLLQVVLNLKDVYRYSNLTTVIHENVLAHQYTMAVTGIIFSQYLNQELGENIDIYQVVIKSLFHDFGEYKGNEIVTQVKNYNEDTKKMFKMMEEADEKDLEEKIGKNLFQVITSAMEQQEGYILELLDKMIAIMKLWIEVEYMGNQTYIKSICSIFQSRFKRFKKVEKIDSLKNKEFYLDLVRYCYIYVKEHLLEYNPTLLLQYFTKQEQEEMRREIAEIREDKTKFLI